MIKTLTTTVSLLLALYPLTGHADLARKLRPLLGYTVVHSGTVTGYISEKGKKSDSFEGCDFDRKIIIDDQYVVTCATYSYSYAYRPDAVILSNKGNLKMIVENEIYDIRK